LCNRKGIWPVKNLCCLVLIRTNQGRKPSRNRTTQIYWKRTIKTEVVMVGKGTVVDWSVKVSPLKMKKNYQYSPS